MVFSEGDIIEVQIPPASTNPTQQQGAVPITMIRSIMSSLLLATDGKHKGFGFVTFASAGDAQDAIDNMDLNELKGKVIRVNLARPLKVPIQGTGNKASAYPKHHDLHVTNPNH